MCFRTIPVSFFEQLLCKVALNFTMDYVKMQEAGEHIMKSRCQIFFSRFFTFYMDRRCNFSFGFLPPLPLLFSSASHVAGTPRSTRR